MADDARTARLRAAAQRKSEETEARARRAIIALEATGQRINFNTVAAAAGVSKDFLYRHPSLRQQIVDRRQAPPRTATRTRTAEDENVRSESTKLAVVSQALRELRAENAELRKENARLLGELARAKSRSR